MWSQGNSLYLTAYQKSTKKCVNLPLNYKSQDYSLDSDNDKILFLFEQSNSGETYYVFAIFDTQRIVFV